MNLHAYMALMVIHPIFLLQTVIDSLTFQADFPLTSIRQASSPYSDHQVITIPQLPRLLRSSSESGVTHGRRQDQCIVRMLKKNIRKQIIRLHWNIFIFLFCGVRFQWSMHGFLEQGEMIIGSKSDGECKWRNLQSHGFCGMVLQK
ncbi:hypothetical protein JTE90_028259 [Oedothorax gibbosus]|uniref:Uncharacterized protein n=1 Tax=Oedothorax gibbosus TaxID=931172 RepID=A0AAV6UCF8_9ARAC|nr:hypothetical protein JTE90_028259 [Oedothorax gibbosus]